jgi:bifunctional UDP-N-acetylglucosamine pyrophosphorylase / glucosamine-1-phosphate N-acetyltransferase
MNRLGILVLAAGQGTRMRSALPKVLHPLAGRPLLAHVLEAASQLQPRRVCVVYGHGGEQVRGVFASRAIEWVEQSEQRGTGHAVGLALPALEDVDRVLILYGDVPLIESATLDRLLQEAADAPLAVLTVVLSDPTGYGRMVRTPAGRVCRIVEHRDASEAEREIEEINTGILVADRERLVGWLGRVGRGNNSQGEVYLTDVVALAVADGVEVVTAQAASPEEVAGVNDRVQLAALERHFQRRQAEHLMRGGVTLADPTRFDLRGQLRAGRDVFIDLNILIEGEVTLGDRVKVGPNCVLRDCTIGADSEILASSVIEGARVGGQARIGPFARLRPETELAEQVHIGNFVEIKKSQVGSGSKINHLSYVGDALIGEDVNVGAGTITCNYDGANKHRTVIGDRAFIGSDTQLVAPVEVGANATIGAGSTITRDAPPDQLTVSRSRQMSLSGWRRPEKPKG